MFIESTNVSMNLYCYGVSLHCSDNANVCSDKTQIVQEATVLNCQHSSKLHFEKIVCSSYACHFARALNRMGSFSRM